MKKTVSLLILLFATTLFAEEIQQGDVIYPAADEPVSEAEMIVPDASAPGAGSALTGIFYVIFLGALGTIAWYFWRQRSPVAAGCSSKALKGIQIGATRSLGNRQFLVVARYNNKELLLGVGPGFINKVESFDVQKEEGDLCSKEPSA